MGKSIETYREYGNGPYGIKRTIQILTLNCPECHNSVRWVFAEEERQWKEMYEQCEKELVFFRDRALELEIRNGILTRTLDKKN